MKTGTVKWFNNAKGFGFILSDDTKEDLFAHYSAIEMDGYKTLKAGQAVKFETRPSDKGLHAINIKLSEYSSNKSNDPAKQYDNAKASSIEANSASEKTTSSIDYFAS